MSDREHAHALLAMAKKDLRALSGMLNSETFADEIFGFHAQQAVEKALKACIAAQGITYPLTHDISELLALLEEENIEVEPFWEFIRYNAFAVQFRYEVLDVEVPIFDRESVVKEVKGLVEYVKRTL